MLIIPSSESPFSPRLETQKNKEITKLAPFPTRPLGRDCIPRVKKPFRPASTHNEFFPPAYISKHSKIETTCLTKTYILEFAPASREEAGFMLRLSQSNRGPLRSYHPGVLTSVTFIFPALSSPILPAVPFPTQTSVTFPVENERSLVEPILPLVVRIPAGDRSLPSPPQSDWKVCGPTFTSHSPTVAVKVPPCPLPQFGIVARNIRTKTLCNPLQGRDILC